MVYLQQTCSIQEQMLLFTKVSFCIQYDNNSHYDIYTKRDNKVLLIADEVRQSSPTSLPAAAWTNAQTPDVSEVVACGAGDGAPHR